MMHTHALIKRLHQLLDLVIPDTCVLCRRTVPAHQPHLLCDHCWRALARNEQACRSCALPLANGISELCGACQNHPLNTSLTVAPLLYEGTVRHLLQRFKFHKGWREGVCLASLLGTSIGNRYLHEDLPQLLLPVPLSRLSRWRRGFNQANYLAVHVGRQLNIPVAPNAIHKRHRPAQRSLSRSSRRALDQSSFVIHKPLNTSHVALVDDVLTTGSTVSALRRVLINHGVQRVDIWCACRAVLA